MYIHPNSRQIDTSARQLKSRDISSFDKDSVLNKKKSELLSAKTPTNNTITPRVDYVQKIKQLIPKSTISVGYDYGFLPYTINMTAPASAVKTEGRIETDICNIPLDVTFFYTSQKNVIGLNNYFRISYNADRYKNKVTNKVNENLNSYKNNLNDLNTQKQQLLGKMAYSDYLLSVTPDKWPVSEPSLSKQKLQDTLSIEQINSLPSKPDTFKIEKPVPVDTVMLKQALYQHKIDSVSEVYNTYKSNYKNLNDSINRVQNKIRELESYRTGTNESSYKGAYANKIERFFSGVKKLDVGLCYPAYSTFLTNNIPVRGINFEYQKNNLFYAFTYGTTVSTLLSNGKSNVGNLLNGVRNSYNYFDVNNLSAGQKILSTKFGFGEKTGDHFYFGLLIGKGYNTYYSHPIENGVKRTVASNFVFEADIRRKFGKNTVVDVVGAKSSLQQGNLNLDLIQSASQEIFSNFRSYALLTKLSTKLVPTKTNLSFSVRWVDPFFKSYGIGFMRSDNLRYEIKVDQVLGKKLQYTVIARREEDNLLRLLDYKNTFYSLNNALTYKVKRGLTMRVGYTPLTRTLTGSEFNVTNKSAIYTGIVSFTPVRRKVQMQFNVAYNYYLVNTDSVPINFQNLTYYHQVTFKTGFKTSLNLSWFKNNLRDTVGNDVFLGVLDFGYLFKNSSSVSVAGKVAYKVNTGVYPGFILKSTCKLTDVLFWENQIEKFIVGELYSGSDLQSIKNFPYCVSTKLILNF